MIANRIFYTGAHLAQFKLDIAGVVAVTLFIVGNSYEVIDYPLARWRDHDHAAGLVRAGL